jgi:hypothetical protein
MRQEMKSNIGHNEQLQDAETNCKECVLRKKEDCPYLEEMLNCRLFKDSESQHEYSSE